MINAISIHTKFHLEIVKIYIFQIHMTIKPQYKFIDSSQEAGWSGRILFIHCILALT